MSFKSKKNIVLIGLGAIGKMHASRLLNNQLFCFKNIVDPTPTAKNYAQAHHLNWYQSYGDLINNQAIDGAIVATPNNLHCEIALDLLSKGIPVLLEKPITDNLEDAWKLVRAEKHTSTPLLIGHHRRHNPIIKRAKQIISSGILGKVVAANVMANFLKPSSYFKQQWHTEPGAGPILINLIHDIDLMRVLLGDIESVQAIKTNQTRKLQIEDTAGVLVGFKSGAIGSFVTSDSASSPWNWDLCAGEAEHYAQQHENTHFICGTDGSLTLPWLTIWKYKQQGSAWQDPITSETTILHRADPYIEQLNHFAELIDGKANSLCPGIEGLRTLQITEAIHQACKSGRKITIDYEQPEHAI